MPVDQSQARTAVVARAPLTRIRRPVDPVFPHVAIASKVLVHHLECLCNSLRIETCIFNAYKR